MANFDMGGVRRFIDKDSFQKKPEKKVNTLLSYKKADSTDVVLSSLEDDGKPLKNEFLEEVRIREEKQALREKIIHQNYKEESYKEFVNDLLEASDDIFDSKGDDISKKEFLKNEMDVD